MSGFSLLCCIIFHVYELNQNSYKDFFDFFVQLRSIGKNVFDKHVMGSTPRTSGMFPRLFTWSGKGSKHF